MKLLIRITSALCLLATPALAQQVVLDFEDLSGFAPIPAGYGGVANWGSWAHSDTVDANYPPASGATRIFSVGPQQSIQFGQDVTFEGANVVSALDFSWELWYQGAVVHTSAVLTPNTGGPAVWLPSGYTGLVDELRYVSAVNVHAVDDFTYSIPAPVGSTYCNPAQPNSTGLPGVLAANGSDVAADNDLTLTASDLPEGQFGYFLCSQSQGVTPFPGGSQGVLCLLGNIGRFNALVAPVSGGSLSISVDTSSVPVNPAQPILAGETWSFQCWYRDLNPGNTSNFTDAVAITFN